MNGVPRLLTRLICRQMSTRIQNTQNIWKEVNRLASQGTWDNINCMPKMFLFGSKKREAYAVYNAINTKSDVWSSSPYGMFGKAIFRIVLFISSVQVGVMLYEFIVPEEKRLHYKYRDKHGDDHGHH